MEDIIEKLVCCFDTFFGDVEPQKLHLSLCELKFIRIESASSSAPYLQKLTDAEEVLLYGVVVHDAVIHAGEMIALECGHDVSLPVSVGVASTEESLRGCAVLITSPRCQESCKFSVSWVEGDRMVTIPAIHR